MKNGGKYLPLCVESILAQHYENFELIILENQSADGTAEWLQELKGKDSRIKLIPSETPLSIEDNWKRISAIQKNEFMTMIGHDDLLEPDFLDEINNLIQSEPGANLYLTHFKLIDSEGKLIRYCRPIPKHETTARFLASRMTEIRDSFGTGYVMRSELYDRLGGIPPYRNLMFADDALWLQAMRGSFNATSPNVCFSYRLHAGSASGKPSSEALVEGQIQYFSLLDKLADEDEDLSNIMNIYAPQFVSRLYNDLLMMTPLMQQVDQTKFSEFMQIALKFHSGIAPNLSHISFSKRLCVKVSNWI